jgi:hypothetical protein
MSDLKTLAQLRRLRPSGAVETAVCAVCGEAHADKVSDGILPDGQTAEWVPTCQHCFDQRKATAPPPTAG